MCVRTSKVWVDWMACSTALFLKVSDQRAAVSFKFNPHSKWYKENYVWGQMMGQLLPFLVDIHQALFAISANLMLDSLMDKDWQLFSSSVIWTKVTTASSLGSTCRPLFCSWGLINLGGTGINVYCSIGKKTIMLDRFWQLSNSKESWTETDRGKLCKLDILHPAIPP